MAWRVLQTNVLDAEAGVKQEFNIGFGGSQSSSSGSGSLDGFGSTPTAAAPVVWYKNPINWVLFAIGAVFIFWKVK